MEDLLLELERLLTLISSLEKEREDLRNEREGLRKKNRSLRDENEDLKRENEALRNLARISEEKIRVIDETFRDLEDENETLKAKAKKSEGREREAEEALKEAEEENKKMKGLLSKNPNNSSMPSSASPYNKRNTRACSLREPSGLSCGGQVGHKGSTMLIPDAEEIREIKYFTATCRGCFYFEECKKGTVFSPCSSKSEVDIKVIRILTTLVRMKAKRCPMRKKPGKGSIPKNLRARAQYGEVIRAS